MGGHTRLYACGAFHTQALWRSHAHITQPGTDDSQLVPRRRQVGWCCLVVCCASSDAKNRGRLLLLSLVLSPRMLICVHLALVQDCTAHILPLLLAAAAASAVVFDLVNRWWLAQGSVFACSSDEYELQGKRSCALCACVLRLTILDFDLAQPKGSRRCWRAPALTALGFWGIQPVHHHVLSC
ncbi:unnamed protein product [Pylaiella littoralis]